MRFTHEKMSKPWFATKYVAVLACLTYFSRKNNKENTTEVNTQFDPNKKDDEITLTAESYDKLVELIKDPPPLNERMTAALERVREGGPIDLGLPKKLSQ